MTRIEVKPGQVWEDCDRRVKGRQVQVLAVPSDAVGYTEVTVQVVRHPNPKALGRKLSVNLRRFRPGSTGYRLVSDPSVATPSVQAQNP